MKKALVVGASGGIGYALVSELVSRGISVTAFSRGKEKLERLYKNQHHVTIFSGDVFNKQALLEAAKEVEVIFHAVSFPYQEWEQKHLVCLEQLLDVAATKQAKFVLADNLYAYGRQSDFVTEYAKKEPHTKKGKIRLAMEHKMKANDVPTLIAHLPDVYGPNAENTLLHETLKKVVQDQSAHFVGNLKVAREYLYTCDGAKAIVELSLQSETYNQTWNIPASCPITGEELIAIIREITGYQKAVRVVSKKMIRLMGIFSPFMREMVEMMYLTEHPVLLSGEKYEKEIHALPRTPYKQGITETITWMKRNH